MEDRHPERGQDGPRDAGGPEWTYAGDGHWTCGAREVDQIGPRLFQARVRRHRGWYDLVDSTIYGTPAAAQAAAARLAERQAAGHEWRTCGHRADYASEAEHDRDCPASEVDGQPIGRAMRLS